MSDSAMHHRVVAADADPLDQLRRHLVQLATSADVDALGAAHVIQSLDPSMLFDQFSEYFCIKDRCCRFVFANAAAMSCINARSMSSVLGRTELDFLDRETAEQRLALEQDLMAQGANCEREEMVRLPDGAEKWLLTTRTSLRDAKGDVVGLMVMSRDITRARQEAELERGHAAVLEMVARGRPLPAVLDALCCMIENQLQGIYASVLLLDEAGERLRHGAAPSLPPSYTRLIDGVAIGPSVGSCGTAAWRRCSIVVRDIQSDPLWADFRHLAMPFRLRSCWSTPIMGANNRVLGTFALYSNEVREPTAREIELTAMATDLAGIAIERAMNERRIQHLAYHDPLTGLPNRTLFWAQFARTLMDARRESRKLTVAYLDLDNFKQVNDTHGHAAGDEVLKRIAERIEQRLRPNDLAVRLGGDEFAIVLADVYQDEVSALMRLREIHGAIAEDLRVGTARTSVTCSIGVSFHPQDGDTAEALLAAADRAMYEAKAQGRDALQVIRRVPA
ncbi:diguanylate cyclase domain-containing protein [Rhizobium straminoryzae]|uniref:Diguanylate cyclase n=1 Tax=Rhizobium straminoryzae TaxID=1387186 RepID=A0A549T1R9_9HYPH|nr:diguanylate cyclase [Rhizobium straminoryzae]TRL35778.1 diguanylate cyclase [Rhizobium straminoryzae]